MIATLKSTAIAILSGLLLTAFTAAPALAQWMGRSMGCGMWGGCNCRMMDMTAQPVDPAALPQPASPGARILLGRCTQCHGLVSPKQHAAQEWPVIVDRMNRRMLMMAQGRMGMMRRNIQPLTAKEKTTLLAYLQANAFQALSQEALPQTGQPGSRDFVQICSRCHALPDPAIHTAPEWPSVLARMEHNMKNVNMETLTTEQKTSILDFLRKHARGK